MSKQQERQNAVRAITGTSYFYQDDWHALFDIDGIAEGPFNERLKNWINQVLGASYQNVNDAMRMFAIDQGFTRWAEMGDFAVGARIQLSNTSIDDDSIVGDLVGLLSVDNGSGSYTFSITADPQSKFVLDGVDNTRLELENTVRFATLAEHTVTISATNGVNDPISRTFYIAVNAVVAPSFVSAAAQSVADDTAFSLELETDEPCAFAVIGGADADQFDLTTDDLSTLALDYDNPQDSDLNNTYIVQVRATSVATGLAADRTFTVTVQPNITYATWNPADKGGNLTLSNGNLTVENNTNGWNSVRATLGKTTGKWYWELTQDSGASDATCGLPAIMDDGADITNYAGFSAKSAGAQVGNTYNGLVNGVTGNHTGAVGAMGAGTVFGFAMDVDAGKIWISKNGTWVNGDPTGAHVWGIGADTWFPAFSGNSTAGFVWTANFGATPFVYTVPTGFNAGVYV